jgi:hypothetical protein
MVVILHLFIVIFLWTSWFLLDYKIVILGMVLFYLQIIIFGDCVLTAKQYKGNKTHSFYAYLFRKIGFKNVKDDTMNFVAIYIFPGIIVALALIWQLLLKNTPLIY